MRWSGVIPVLRRPVAERLDRRVDRGAELAVEHQSSGTTAQSSGLSSHEVLDARGRRPRRRAPAATAGRVLGRVAQHPPRRPAAQPAPHLLRRRVTDRRNRPPLRGHQRLLLVDVHPPAGRDANSPTTPSTTARPQPAAVHERATSSAARYSDQTHERAITEVDDAGHAATAVVGELVRRRRRLRIGVRGRRGVRRRTSSVSLVTAARLRAPRATACAAWLAVSAQRLGQGARVGHGGHEVRSRRSSAARRARGGAR